MMKTLAKTLFLVAGLLAAGLFNSTGALAATPTTVDGITTIHLDEYNGYFAAKETLASLKPGQYKFVVTNKTNKLVGFQIQDNVTHKTLDKFPLDPGQTKSAVVQISENGFRYRCPINPTAWYEIDHVQARK
jgi:hypothetical protein